MNLRRSFVFFAAVVSLTSSLAASQVQSGEWTMSHTDAAGKIHFSMQSAKGDDHFDSSSDWNAGEFHDVDFANATKHDVHFTLVRDAGRLEGEGFIKNGAGAGLFTYTPAPQYAGQMAQIGFRGIERDKELAFFIQDVSLAYAKQMKALNIEGLDTQKLIPFRIFRVDAQFVGDLKKEGLAQPPAEKLIAFRIHGVTPAYIEKLRARGMQNLTGEQLLKLRIFNIE